MNELMIHKKIELSDGVLYNILVDGLLSFGYNTARAQYMAETVLKGGIIQEVVSGNKISKNSLLESIRRTVISFDYEIEYISDAGREILLNII